MINVMLETWVLQSLIAAFVSHGHACMRMLQMQKLQSCSTGGDVGKLVPAARAAARKRRLLLGAGSLALLGRRLLCALLPSTLRESAVTQKICEYIATAMSLSAEWIRAEQV